MDTNSVGFIAQCRWHIQRLNSELFIAMERDDWSEVYRMTSDIEKMSETIIVLQDLGF